MRRIDTRSTQLSVFKEGSKTVAKIVLLDEKGQFRDNLNPALNVKYGNQQSIDQYQFHQVAPGTYKVEMSREILGKVTFALSAAGGVGEKAANRAGKVVLHPTFPDELRAIPPNVELLNELAILTGGKVSPKASTVFDGSGDNGFVVFRLMPLLVGLCLFLFLLDIWMRRAAVAWRIFGNNDSP